MNTLSMTWLVARHECARLLRSSASWVIAALFAALAAWLFLSRLEHWLSAQTSIGLQDHPPGLAGYLGSNYLAPLAVVLAVLAPLYAMRSFSDEYRDATWALWQSSPVPTTAIVFGKLMGTCLALTVPLVVAVSMILAMAVWTPLDAAVVASGALGLALCTAASAAAGLYCSSLVRQPMLAAIMAIALLAFLWLLGSTTGVTPWLDALASLSPGSHLAGFLQGYPNTADLAYFGLFTVLFAVLTLIRLDALRHTSD